MKRLLTATALLCMAGCTVFQNHARREVSLIGPVGTDTSVLATTADVRIVTERRRQTKTGDVSVLCTEPSPDVAKAISAAGNFSASGGNSTAKGALAVAGGSAEAVAELAGRSTALLALRDGLYHTCEAYANGALGPDAYALVLARYGQLMTTLFLAQDVTSAVAGVSELDADRATASSPSPTVPTGDSSPNQGSNSQTSPPSNEPGATPAASPAANQSAADPPAADPPAADPPAAKQPAANQAAANQQSKQPATRPANSPANTGATGNSATQPAASAAATAGVLVLGRMNEDFEDLDLDPVQLLIVACVNEGDPTRQGEQNSWLTQICPKLEDPVAIGGLMKVANSSVQSFGRPGAALDVVAGITGGKGASGSNGNPPTPETPVTPVHVVNPAPKPKVPVSVAAAKAEIVAAQWALLNLGFNVGPVDGVIGPQTRDAIQLFQGASKLPLSRDLDAATLGALFSLGNKTAGAQQPPPAQQAAPAPQPAPAQRPAPAQKPAQAGAK